MQFSNFLKCGLCVDGVWMVRGWCVDAKLTGKLRISALWILSECCVDSAWILCGCCVDANAKGTAASKPKAPNITKI